MGFVTTTRAAATVTASVLAMLAATAAAEPGLLIDLGGKFDSSFNEAAYTGAQRWAEETGGSYMEAELKEEAQREQNMRRMAERGANPLIVLGFANASTLREVAPDYPETTFVIVDEVVEADNVKSVKFAEHEGSYLVGLMAGMASESGTVGFIGGMQIPLIQKFECGYKQGVKSVNPDAEIVSNFVSSDAAVAWNNPVAGREITQAQISQGADVVFAAAGGTGEGVLQQAAESGILGIGVDSNQNGMEGAAGSVLTSMVKRVDLVVYDTFQAAADGTLEPGLTILDLEADGVGAAMDEHNAELVSPEMEAAVEAAEAAIISGEIEVHDYSDDDSCPVE